MASQWPTNMPSGPSSNRLSSETTQSFNRLDLIYIHKKTQFRQVSILSSDITARLLKTATQRILVASVYVPRDPSVAHEHYVARLTHRLRLISLAWEETKGKWGADVQPFVAKDFNRHDQL